MGVNSKPIRKAVSDNSRMALAVSTTGVNGAPAFDEIRVADPVLLSAVTSSYDPPDRRGLRARRSLPDGWLESGVDLVAKPVGGRLPVIAIRWACQELDRLAANTDSWIWHLSESARLLSVIVEWRTAGDEGDFKPYGYGTLFDPYADPDAPQQTAVGKSIRTGRKALIELWKRQQDEGFSHVALNLKPLRRPASEDSGKLAEHVIPHFGAGSSVV